MRLTALRRLSGGLLDETLLGQLISPCNQCEGEAPARGDDAHAWWKAAVVCQVYPRSFGDSDGDGVVDLPALLEKLPYLTSLGVTAL